MDKSNPYRQKPRWLKRPLSNSAEFSRVKRALSSHGLSTVCQEAQCPNRGECWSTGTATFIILGDTCTRGCAFCAVKRAVSGKTPEGEARRLAAAATDLNLDYVVLTSVTRDDLPDGGASHYAEAVRSIKALSPPPLVEVLIPDYLDGPLDTLLASSPDVLAHNIETVRRLSPSLRHPAFSHDRSLNVLKEAKRLSPETILKSSILLGMGEERSEVTEAMVELFEAGVEILVLGQYLRPGPSNHPVARYLPPEEFAELASAGEEIGFSFVAGAPFARTSYRAAEGYVKARSGG
ncbi:MAG: lipoyl synthase [Deltaproteobacteria bacterium]|nr:MAG: lipoyl synthase [Deltaproteobacteria bacterium]